MSYHSKHCAVPNASSRNDFDPACTCGQEARNAAYLASKTEPTLEQMAEGERLAASGFCQVSRKYRRIVLVPPTSGALAELERVSPEDAKRVREAADRYAEQQARAVLWHSGETRELDAGTFEAFRRARTANSDEP